MYLGGTEKGVPRPFGDAVLDGFDMDIEGGATHLYYADFVRKLRGLFLLSKRKQFYISAAPQCVIPDYYLGPRKAGSALDKAAFDYVVVQFYNNFCGIQAYPGNQFNFELWARWGEQEAKHPNGTMVLLGAPASSYSASNGYLPMEKLSEIVSHLQTKYRNFGGVMLWDVSSAENNNDYAWRISAHLKGISVGSRSTVEVLAAPVVTAQLDSGNPDGCSATKPCPANLCCSKVI